VRQPAYCVVAGHSHIAAFGVPISNQGSAPALSELAHPSGRFRIMTGEWPRTEAYWNEVGNTAAGNTIALFWLGNQHLSRYLLQPDHRFDCVLSSEPDLPLDETATIVPETFVRASFLPTLRGLPQLLRLLQAAGAQPVVCGTPPPSGDDRWIVNYLVNNPQWFRCQKGRPWLHRFNPDGPIDPGAIRLTPRVLRYKLWVVVQDLMRETAVANAVPFLACPTAAQTADGFLRDEYRCDITHANQAYSALVLEDLWRHVTHADRESARDRAHASV
jgi:hypothetical protein